MEEDTEYTKLPVEDRCVHKLWKARLSGYEDAAKLFRQIDDEKSPEFGKFMGLVKKFVMDGNAVAQEKGLEAVLAFVENYAMAGKTVGEVMSGIVAKCIAAPKTKTKELAVQITLMFIEIEKFEAVQEELLKGMEHKNPKIVSACISAITLALREFGSKVISVKPLVKKVHVLLEDRDKGVRDEGKAMVIEIYRWIGMALKPQLTSLKPLQVTELDAEFEKVKGERVTPTRYLRSQQQKQAKIASDAAAAGEGEDGDEDEVDGAAEEVDPYDMMDPVDILSKLPKDFYEKLEAKKWQERKEAVDLLEQLLQSPKLENGDYGDLVRALKKIISKDTNVMVIAVAGKCLASLANGLKKRFQPYAGACVPSLLEKFREKKQNVVVALKDAIDATYNSTTIEAIQEDVLAALENKNPQVKSETASFLARCFTKCTPVMLNKKLLKVYTTALLKLLNDPDPTVRENSAEALGTAMKVVGEKAIMPFMTDLEAIKLTKIKECCDKAVIVAKVPKTSGDRPNTAPAKMARGDGSGTAPKPVKRPTTAAKKPGVKKTAAVPSTGAGKSKSSVKQIERELSPEEVDEKGAEILSEDIISGLGDSNWKTRLAAVEQFTQIVSEMEPSDIPAQVVIRILNKKPGLKDTNFQVLKARLEALKLLAEIAQLSSICIEVCLADVAEKLGDPKNGLLAASTLTALAEATKLELVATQVLDFAFSQKSPKVQQEALSWLSEAIKEFGFVIQPKPIMENVKKAVLATHPGVRTSGIQFTGLLYLYMGQQLSIYFSSEKPALKQQIQAEFDKHEGESPPTPTRSQGNVVKDGDKDEDGDDDDQSPDEKVDLNVHEMMPHVDVSSQITEAIITELRDKNWKVRNEALQKLEEMLKKNRYINNNLGELPPVLAQRLVDSNSKIAAAAIALCQLLVIAMGSQSKVHVHTLFPALLQGLGDSKSWIRTAAISCINTWGENCGYKEFFKNEMVADALKSDSPTLRAELWSWLAEKLPDLPCKSIPKEELVICLPFLFSNIEDRNADVRKNAQEAVLAFMIHLNFSVMSKATEKLKPASRTVIANILEKVRGSVPSKPPPPSKKGAYEDQEGPKTVKSGGAKAAAGSTKPAAKGKVGTKPGGRKKDDDVDISPLLQNNTLKNQRSIDEQKLKVLKWNFTTPREEFVELLRDQMTTANVNKSLMANMFHSDFKYHLKAIEALSEDLPTNGGATKANLDLILKWMTLRFFDTNPSVLLKGLEYLQYVFTMLIEEEYNMFENEASSFIPYLILKIGDPKDAVRNGVKALFKQMERCYSFHKLFAFLMDGLKSKNARQRTECLDQLSSLIEEHGILVCHPSPAVALKEIARQISDRDNSVRNAALNCVVQAFFLEGDKVYKMIGQVSDKDQSLMDERIKRAAKNRPPPGTRPAPNANGKQQLQPPQPQKMVRQGSEGTIKQETPEPEEQSPPPVMRHNQTIVFASKIKNAANSMEELHLTSTQSDQLALNIVLKPRPVSGPFGLDTKLLEKIEGEGIDLCAPKLKEFDLKEILEAPVDIPKGSFPTASRNADMFHPTSAPSLLTTQPKSMQNCATSEQLLDLCISNIASPEFEVAWKACSQVEAILSSDKLNRMRGREDCLVQSCIMQLRLLSNASSHGTSHEVLEHVYRNLLLMLMEFFQRTSLSQRITRGTLIDLVEQLLMLLVNERLEVLENGNAFTRVVNMLIVKLMQNSDHTSITCAFIILLANCSADNSDLPPRFQELTMKCLWKVIRLMPSWDPPLDISMVLYQLHLFLKAYPGAMWKERASDTPLRTVKTLLHTLAKMVGGENILQYVDRIDNLNESELHAYLIRLSKKVKPEEMICSKNPKEPKTQHRLSKLTHEQLSEIFKKIGSKDQTKEGLELLYDFKEHHPEADVEPFLRKSSQFFQDYIERGLQSICMERRRVGDQGLKPLSSATSLSSLGLQETGGALTPFSDGGDSTLYAEHLQTVKSRICPESFEDPDSNNEESKIALYYLERLRVLQARAGMDSSSVPLDPSQPQLQHGLRDDNMTSDENLNLQHSQEESVPRSASSGCGGLGLENLRKRLEAVKSLRR